MKCAASLKVWISFLILTGSLLVGQAPSPQTPAAQPAAPPLQPDFVKQGQELIRQGKADEALALYRKTLETSPDSGPANIAAGSVLDLQGKSEEAKKYFSKAIEIADRPAHKAEAQRAMAVSYAFDGNCKKAVEYEQQVYDYYGGLKNFFQQGEIADEAARICLDAGDLDTADKWYKLGHDTGLKEPSIDVARQDRWNFRLEHAEARVAARRGRQLEAQKHIAAAKAILDKGNIPEQIAFFPYLKAYVEFYGADYKAALEDLNQANQSDPFIQCMIGETYEKLGQKDKAMEYYRKVSITSYHNPGSAYAVPIARKKLS